GHPDLLQREQRRIHGDGDERGEHRDDTACRDPCHAPVSSAARETPHFRTLESPPFGRGLPCVAASRTRAGLRLLRGAFCLTRLTALSLLLGRTRLARGSLLALRETRQLSDPRSHCVPGFRVLLHGRSGRARIETVRPFHPPAGSVRGQQGAAG